jgi:Dyp-type peroxidase family
MVDRDTEEQIELDQIQGDILVGLQKEAQLFVGFAIADVTKFKRFLAAIHLTTGREAILAEDRIKACRTNGGKGLLDIRGVNIAFSAQGLKKLGVPDVDKIADKSFLDGLAVRSPTLNDPPEGPGAVRNWRVGNGTGELDGLLIITGRGKDEVHAVMADLDQAAGSGTWIPFYTEIGTTRPGAEHGHEHFGYLDGVSQPAVRGRIDGVIPTKKFLTPGQNPNDANQGLPGADLHWPGKFVFGYAEQDKKNVEHALGTKKGGLPWMKNGSFMVFRRLEQLVPEFHANAKATAAKLKMDADLLEARMVGRFRSGSPISLDDADNPKLGGDELRNNDFDFGGKDPDGLKCPFAGHIRKAYPRNDVTPAAVGQTQEDKETSSEADTQTHRIMRRGIPFGPEVGPAENASAETHHSRGLMFVCYQTSIADQFEFITQNWINNPNFAIRNAGFDPVLGQAEGANRQRKFTGAAPNAPSGKPPEVTLDADFVRPTGGGYFFMPSIYAIQTVLTKQ